MERSVMLVIETHDASFQNTLSYLCKNVSLVVIDFYAQWCGPCKRIAPQIQEMSQQYHGVVAFMKVDVDEVQLEPSHQP